MHESRKLRDQLNGANAAVAIGAHDALSARLVAEAGFDAVWASGFGVSAVRAVPDANVLTMTETLAAAKAMIHSASVPVIADCDSGYGNAINVIRTVEEFSRGGAAAVCLEDNVFPKRCSFYGGVQRDLVSIEEHAEKIRAAVHARVDPDFVVIARTEAFIAGEGLDLALRRAHAYADAGADAILVHSKVDDAREIQAFAERWQRRLPLVAVPTTYGATSIEELEACGVRLVILANQLLRASIRSMRDVLETFRADPRADAVKDLIVPLSDVYQLVDLDGLQENEGEYLVRSEPTSAVIIAAGFERNLMPLNHNRPKGMLEAGGESILGRQLRTLRDNDINDVSIVRGHQKDAIDFANVRYFDNERYRETGEAHSLFCAEEALEGRLVFLYSDILFDSSIVDRLLAAQGDIVLVVDRAITDQDADEVRARRPDLVQTGSGRSAGHRFVSDSTCPPILQIGRNLDLDDADGEFIGMALFSARGAELLREAWSAAQGHSGPFHEADTVDLAAFTDVIHALMAGGTRVDALPIYKGWMEVNTAEEHHRAQQFLTDNGDPRPQVAGPGQ